MPSTHKPKYTCLPWCYYLAEACNYYVHKCKNFWLDSKFAKIKLIIQLLKLYILIISIDESSEGRWYWTYSLQVANFTAWAQNEPDDGIMGDYASLKSDEYSWDDETPTSTAYPICQFFVWGWWSKYFLCANLFA